jgi:hypothetical protein
MLLTDQLKCYSGSCCVALLYGITLLNSLLRFRYRSLSVLNGDAGRYSYKYSRSMDNGLPAIHIEMQVNGMRRNDDAMKLDVCNHLSIKYPFRATYYLIKRAGYFHRITLTIVGALFSTRSPSPCPVFCTKRCKVFLRFHSSVSKVGSHWPTDSAVRSFTFQIAFCR